MIKPKFVKAMAIALAVSGMMFAVTASHDAEAQALEPLNPGRSTSGVINATRSRLVLEGNQQLLANDYSFEGQSGDELKIWIESQGNLNVKLVVFDPFEDRVLIQDNDPQLEQGVTLRLRSPGTYLLRVLNEGNNEGNYTIKIEATNPDRERQADLVMRDLNLTMTPCGNPELAVIIIGTETRCTRDMQKGGEYLYNPTTGQIEPKQNELQETVKDRVARQFEMRWVPCGGQGLAEIAIDGEAVCTRDYPAGKYTYNATTNRFEPVQVADRNLEKLQQWGLNPVVCRRGVVSILMDGQEYCTQPSDWLNIGHYRYIPAEDRLEPISSPIGTTDPNREPVQPQNGTGL
jgi:hypothetical protein